MVRTRLNTEIRSSALQQRQAQSLKRGGMAITEIAQTLGCSRHTVYKALGQLGALSTQEVQALKG